MRRTSRLYFLLQFAFISFLYCASFWTSVSGAKELVEIHRIVVIGDVHGDAENFLKALRAADLIEAQNIRPTDILKSPPKWKFSRTPNASVKAHTTLVQLGDLIDRGEQDFEALNVAIGLQEQTQQHPSTEDKVILLVGNHELLNIQGYYHYVNKNNYGGFISRPLRMEAMDADGAFGKYIIDNFKTAHLEEGTLFVHAGMESDMGISDIDLLNSQVQSALRNRDFRHLYLRSNGPLWTRKMIGDSMQDSCDDVVKMLKTFDAARVVVGHTPQHSGQIEQYCNGQVIAADVGMSRWMYNKVVALEMVFLKYVDSDELTTSKKILIREIREGSRAYPSSGVWQSEASTVLSTKPTDVGDDEGDL